MLSGQNATSPRRRLEVGSNVGGDDYGRTSGPTLVGALIIPPYKILLGDGYNDTLYNSMLAELNEVQKGVYSPMRGTTDPAACEKAMGDYGGFWGPFIFASEDAE